MWDGGQNEMGFGEARQVKKGGRRGERGKRGIWRGNVYVCMYVKHVVFWGEGAKGVVMRIEN